MGKIKNTCAAISPVRAAYGNLDVVHHGKVPACSLVCTYYTGNRLSPHQKVVLEIYKNFQGDIPTPEDELI
jgi:hypothetical protein